MNTQSIMDDSFENGQEITTNDGILVRRGPAAFMPEIANKTTGTLSLVHYINHTRTVLCIEWKPNDFLIADADSQENGDWSLVDTIAKRRRTPSESLAFDPPPPPPQSTPAVPAPAVAAHVSAPPRLLRVPITDLHHIAVAKKNHILQLVRRSDGSVHSEYFFQHGNAEGFVRGLQTTHCLRRSHQRPDQYEIVDNVEHDTEKLQKTFEELRIDDIKGAGGGWLSSMVRDPFSHTLGLLAKMSDAYAVLPGLQQYPSGASDPASYATAARAHRTQLRQQRMAAAAAAANGVATNGGSNGGDDRPASTSSVGSPPAAAMLAEYDMLSNTTGSSPRSSDLDGSGSRALESRLPPRPTVQRGGLLTAEQWATFVAEDGRIADVDGVRERIFRGGIENGLRREVWQYLLGFRRWDETHEQRRRSHAQKSSEYFKMKMQWLSMTATQEKNFLGYQARKCQIEKDVLRTDRTIEFFEGDDNKNVGRLQDILMTYVMYNFDLGYVQGMSDLLAPILAVMQDEVESFWCFVGFMEMVESNFDLDQGGMKHQLRDLHALFEFCNPRLFEHFLQHQSDNMYVCFRWLLVWFKREFTYYDIMSLWEVMWTRLPCVNFQLLISVAILDEQMETIIGRGYEFNEILKFVNELSYRMDFRAILMRAEAIYLQMKASEHLTDKVRAIIGEEPLDEVAANGGTVGVEEDLDGFDNIASPVKSLREMEEEQRKIEEACERSMYSSFY